MKFLRIVTFNNYLQVIPLDLVVFDSSSTVSGEISSWSTAICENNEEDQVTEKYQLK